MIIIIPSWVKRTIYGGLICLYCGGIVLQVGQSFNCQNDHCKKHYDEPVRRSQGFGGLNNPNQIISTASGTTPYMVVSNSTTSTT